MKVITADDVGALIADEATLFLGGLAVSSLPEEVLQGLERHFLATGHPRMLSTWACNTSSGRLDTARPPRNSVASSAIRAPTSSAVMTFMFGLSMGG